jgi:hypothetical protein
MTRSERLAVLDAIGWLEFFNQGNAVGKLGAGLREAVIQENQERLLAAIAALRSVLREKGP